MHPIMELLLAVRERTVIFYHKDTNQFDYQPFSEKEWEHLRWDERLPLDNANNVRLPSYEEIDHKGIMRYFVKEWVEDPAMRKALFNVLRRHDYIDAFLEKVRELGLTEDFEEVCIDLYIQIFEEWKERNGLIACWGSGTGKGPSDLGSTEDSLSN